MEHLFMQLFKALIREGFKRQISTVEGILKECSIIKKTRFCFYLRTKSDLFEFFNVIGTMVSYTQKLVRMRNSLSIKGWAQ